MQINKISGISYNNFNFIKAPIKKERQIEGSAQLSGFVYPKNYYISFLGRKKKYRTPIQTIEKIGEENFPTTGVLEAVRNADPKTFRLHKTHLEHYSRLLDCRSLDDIKAMGDIYPEFQGVIDASTMAYDDMPACMKKIADGMNPEISINDLTFELIKRYYGQLKRVKLRENYFNIDPNQTKLILDTLLIPRFKKPYSVLVTCDTPEYKTKMSEIRQDIWDHDDGTMRERARKVANEKGINTPKVRKNNALAHLDPDYRQRASEITRDYYEKHPEAKEHMSIIMRDLWASEEALIDIEDETTVGRMHRTARENARYINTKEVREKIKATVQSAEFRQKASERMLKKWEDDDGTMRDRQRDLAIKNLHSPESRAKAQAKLRTPEARKAHSERLKQFYKDHPEYKQAQQDAFDRHPEIIEKMSEIAKEYPRLSGILAKQRQGKSLTGAENAHYLGYLARCHEEIPDFSKIVGKEYHNILVERGIIKGEIWD